MKIYLPQIVSVDEETVKKNVSFEGDSVAGYRVLDHPEFVLTVTHHKDRDLEITGEGCLELEMQCGRCLEPVPIKIPFSIQRKANFGTRKDDEGDEVCFFDEENLLVDDLILDQAVMNLPIRVLCREDCKGICTKCGANLNLGKCSCESKEAPTRMAEALSKAFADIKLED